ncbi:MAG: hypothetical protein Q9205_006695 [Flavoplaca limonia]
MFNTRLLFLVLFYYFDLGLSQAQCFFPSGEEAIGDVPCNPTAADSLSRNGSSCCEDGVYIILDTARPVTVIPEEGETVSSSSAITSSDQPRTSSLSSASEPSNPSPAAATTPPTDSTPREDSDNNDSTNKGLAAGLGVVLGLAVIGGLLFGLYKWNQRRKMKKQPHSMKRSSAPTSAPEGVSLPPSMVERNGQMEWELPTREGDHESESYAQGPYAQTRETPMNQSGYQS